MNQYPNSLRKYLSGLHPAVGLNPEAKPTLLMQKCWIDCQIVCALNIAAKSLEMKAKAHIEKRVTFVSYLIVIVLIIDRNYKSGRVYRTGQRLNFTYREI